MIQHQENFPIHFKFNPMAFFFFVKIDTENNKEFLSVSNEKKNSFQVYTITNALNKQTNKYIQSIISQTHDVYTKKDKEYVYEEILTSDEYS